MSRTMRTLALAFVMVLASAVAASAHTSSVPVITCGTVTTQFQDFPAGTHAVTTYLSVDGAAASPLQGSFTGRSGQVKAGFTPPGDGLQHTYRAQVAWSDDGGGRSAIATATLICPPAPIQPPAVTPPVVTPPVVTPPASTLPAASTCTTSTCPCTTCTSRRVYTFTTRRMFQGQRVVGVPSVIVRGHELVGAASDRFGKVVRHNGRFRVTASFAGLVVPKGQVRTVTVWLRLAAGNHRRARSVRTVQFVRLCLANDGNPNDPGSQDRARL
jgi:hypothetical protein